MDTRHTYQIYSCNDSGFTDWNVGGSLWCMACQVLTEGTKGETSEGNGIEEKMGRGATDCSKTAAAAATTAATVYE